MDEKLKQRLLSNDFVVKIRGSFEVDEESYESLCAALRDLAKEWRDKPLIDKEVMQTIYGADKSALAMIHTIGDTNPDLTDRLEAMAIELDGLILQCLSTPMSVEELEKRMKLWGIRM